MKSSLLRLIAVAVFLFCTGHVSASAQETNSAADSDCEMQTVVITVAAEPDPATRYLFWPPVHEQRHINAMAFFSRAMLMHAEVSMSRNDDGLSEEQNQRWHEGPWKEEYVDQIRDYLQPYQALLSELDRATPCMDVDYPMLTTEMSLRDSVSVLLPEIQRSRLNFAVEWRCNWGNGTSSRRRYAPCFGCPIWWVGPTNYS